MDRCRVGAGIDAAVMAGVAAAVVVAVGDDTLCWRADVEGEDSLVSRGLLFESEASDIDD